jgi:GLPGLI family protein
MSVIDSGNVRISYALNAIEIKNQSTFDDLQLLEIGITQSKYYSFFVSNSDSLCTDWHLKNPNPRVSPWRMGPQGKYPLWSEYQFSEYYKNFTTNTLIEYARMPHKLESANAYYEEELPVFNWEIQTDTLSVMTYQCQKATCRFRGRDFVAWFTPDIPISNGPWKFGGLPGLILKISDTGGVCDFECIKIEQLKHKFPIKKHNEYNTKYKKKDRETILKFQKEIHENYIKLAGLKLFPNFGGEYTRQLTENARKNPPKKHEPIELE